MRTVRDDGARSEPTPRCVFSRLLNGSCKKYSEWDGDDGEPIEKPRDLKRHKFRRA